MSQAQATNGHHPDPRVAKLLELREKKASAKTPGPMIRCGGCNAVFSRELVRCPKCYPKTTHVPIAAQSPMPTRCPACGGRTNTFNGRCLRCASAHTVADATPDVIRQPDPSTAPKPSPEVEAIAAPVEAIAATPKAPATRRTVLGTSKVDEIVDLIRQRKKRHEIAEATGVSVCTIDRVLHAARLGQLEGVDPATIPPAKLGYGVHGYSPISRSRAPIPIPMPMPMPAPTSTPLPIPISTDALAIAPDDEIFIVTALLSGLRSLSPAGRDYLLSRIRTDEKGGLP